MADWPTGKPGDFPVGPCFTASESFSGPRPYTRIYLIELTQSADRLDIQRTGHDVRSVSPSERMTVMYIPLIRIKTISDENKKPSCRFYEHNCRAGLTIQGPIYQRKAGPPSFSSPPFRSRSRPLKFIVTGSAVHWCVTHYRQVVCSDI